MKKNSSIKFQLFFASMVFAFSSNAQSWFRESFNAVGVPNDTTPALWIQNIVSGSTSYLNGNGFRRASSSSFPTCGPGGFEGAGFLRFDNRSATYPAPGAWCVAGDAATLVTPPLDWRGRKNTSDGWISLRFFRSNSVTGGVHLVPDSISIYLNDKPNLTDALILTETKSNSTFIPRSSIMAPTPIGTTNGWNLLEYSLPAFGAFGSRFDTSSTVYLVVKETSQGGDNMYLDSVNVPYYPLILSDGTIPGQFSGSFDLLPNPATSYVSVHSNKNFDNNAVVNVYDLTGRRLDVMANKIEENLLELNIEQLGSGIYTVLISTNKSIVNKKLIIAR